MGATLSNPIGEAEQTRIHDTIENVLKIFAVEFSKSYTQAVIENAKEELEPSKDLLDDLKLQDAPLPCAFLKTGLLVKVIQYFAVCLFV